MPRTTTTNPPNLALFAYDLINVSYPSYHSHSTYGLVIRNHRRSSDHFLQSLSSRLVPLPSWVFIHVAAAVSRVASKVLNPRLLGCLFDFRLGFSHCRTRNCSVSGVRELIPSRGQHHVLGRCDIVVDAPQSAMCR